MSGGSFGYAYARADAFAAELADRLADRERVDAFGETPNAVSDNVYAALRRIQRLALITAQFMREAELFYSADTSETTFLLRVAGLDVLLESRDIHLSNDAQPPNDGDTRQP